jgi:hypothetical protein
MDSLLHTYVLKGYTQKHLLYGIFKGNSDYMQFWVYVPSIKHIPCKI